MNRKYYLLKGVCKPWKTLPFVEATLKGCREGVVMKYALYEWQQEGGN